MSIDWKQSKSVTTVTKRWVELSHKDIKEALGLPDNAKITVQVPSGGDYSGCELDLSYEVTLDIYYEEFYEHST